MTRETHADDAGKFFRLQSFSQTTATDTTNDNKIRRLNRAVDYAIRQNPRFIKYIDSREQLKKRIHRL